MMHSHQKFSRLHIQPAYMLPIKAWSCIRENARSDQGLAQKRDCTRKCVTHEKFISWLVRGSRCAHSIEPGSSLAPLIIVSFQFVVMVLGLHTGHLLSPLNTQAPAVLAHSSKYRLCAQEAVWTCGLRGES